MLSAAYLCPLQEPMGQPEIILVLASWKGKTSAANNNKKFQWKFHFSVFRAIRKIPKLSCLIETRELNEDWPDYENWEADQSWEQ